MKKTYLQHQSNSFTDIKIIKMRSKLGIESYGIFWALLELLFNEENKLCIDDYSVLAFSLQCDPDKLKSVIEDFDLFVIEDGCFYSKRLKLKKVLLSVGIMRTQSERIAIAMLVE
jgi:hypothetical protein